MGLSVEPTQLKKESTNLNTGIVYGQFMFTNFATIELLGPQYFTFPSEMIKASVVLHSCQHLVFPDLYFFQSDECYMADGWVAFVKLLNFSEALFSYLWK